MKSFKFQYNQIKIDKNILIENVNINLEEGSFSTIIGKSGAGKSTLIKTILNDEIINSKYSIGYMPQNEFTFNYMNLWENLLFVLKLKNKEKKISTNDIKQLEDLLKKFDLFQFKDLYPHQLSGGIKSRVAILRAYLIGEEIIILDEPLSNLDWIIKQDIIKWLQKIKKELNLTILMISHDLDDALKLSDNIYILKRRRIFKVENLNSYQKEDLINELI